VVDADLDVRLAWGEQRRSEVQEREVVLPGEVLDGVGNCLEAAVARVLRVRIVVEELR
jgi:hypothetical protein